MQTVVALVVTAFVCMERRRFRVYICIPAPLTAVEIFKNPQGVLTVIVSGLVTGTLSLLRSEYFLDFTRLDRA